jgi:hypothetical protein
MPVCNLQLLPAAPTQLQYQGKLYARLDGEYQPSILSLPPQLLQLAGLLRLKLCDCNIPPTVLGALTRLQALCLEHCALLPRNAAAADDDDNTFSTVGTAALFDVLDRLTNLQDLELSLEGLDTASTAPQRFSALTASTQLTRLVLNPMTSRCQRAQRSTCFLHAGICRCCST